MQKSFVRYIGLRFKKARLHSWAKEKYVNAENRNEAYVRMNYQKMSDLNNMSQEEFNSILNEFNFEPHYFLIIQMLNEFTLQEPNFHIINHSAELFRNAGAKISYNENSFEFELESLKFKAIKLSQYFPAVIAYLPDIETRNRTGKCHPYSAVAARLLESVRDDNKFNIYLVTGRIYQLSNKSKYLHSWVELEDGEKTFVIDPTKNLVIDRNAYYEINHVQNPEKINSKDLIRDYNKIKKLTEYDEYLVKVYYENAENGRILYDTLVERGEIEESQPNSN